MMYQVKFTTTYKKSYKLMKKRGLDLSALDTVVDLLRQVILHPLQGSEDIRRVAPESGQFKYQHEGNAVFSANPPLIPPLWRFGVFG